MIWPLVGYFVFVVFLVTATLFVSYLLGQRQSEPATGEPYEGGIVSEGSARVRLSVRYYVAAMFFVVFDLEAVFLFAWCVAARELGWIGYGEVLIFVGVLLVALVYLWNLASLSCPPEKPRGRLILGWPFSMVASETATLNGRPDQTPLSIFGWTP